MNNEIASIILFLLIISIPYFGINLIWAYICEFIGNSKGYYKGCFPWGLFLGFIGVIICLCKPNVKNQQIMAGYMDQQTEILNHLSNHESKQIVRTEFEDNVERIREYKKLLDDGIITEDDFEKKKKELLNIWNINLIFKRGSEASFLI